MPSVDTSEISKQMDTFSKSRTLKRLEEDIRRRYLQETDSSPTTLRKVVGFILPTMVCATLRHSKDFVSKLTSSYAEKDSHIGWFDGLMVLKSDIREGIILF